MIQSRYVELEAELEKSREEIVQLADRVKRLVAKRNERELLVQRLHRLATMPRSVSKADVAMHLCTLCATEHAADGIEHVRGCAPGAVCEHCGQPAVMWIQLRHDSPSPPNG